MAGLLPWCGQKRWGGGGPGVPIVEALFCGICVICEEEEVTCSSPKHFRAISYSHLAEARSGEAVESIIEWHAKVEIP